MTNKDTAAVAAATTEKPKDEYIKWKEEVIRGVRVQTADPIPSWRVPVPATEQNSDHKPKE